jgi:hypothetical protein
MNMAEPLQFQKLRGQLRRDEPMSRHVSWRAGGPADRFYIPADLDDLSAFLAAVRRPGLEPAGPRRRLARHGDPDPRREPPAGDG